MKLFFKFPKSFLLLSLFLLPFTNTRSQTAGNAGEYMGLVNDNYAQMKQDTWDYLVAVGNNRSARKVEKRRTELIVSLNSAKSSIAHIKPWENDASLRDSAISFLVFSYNILNQDYAKIVDMEEVSEQSFDAMEGYMLARKRANEKYSLSADRLNETTKAFAMRHNVNLIENEDDKLTEKIKQADTVLAYSDRLFLIMFKSQIQETYVITALQKMDVNSAEQNKNKLLENSNEGLKSLQQVPAFEGDASVKTATVTLLNFYKTESMAKFPIMIDYYLKKENFEKIKSAMDAKPKNSLTKEDTDSYNRAVAEFNAAVGKFNSVNQELNESRAKLVNAWNAASDTFTQKHTPNR